MAKARPRGFSDVDTTDAGDELVAWLGQAAVQLAPLRQAGYPHLRLRPGGSVVDVGCGAGEALIDLAALVAPGGRVIGTDLSATMIDASRETLRHAGIDAELHVADAASLPLPDASVDAARAERLLQHVDDPIAVLHELKRVTRPGGAIVTTT
jgi:ubiquinone/menaquinone biosynthesis C-methylase UbiE